MKNKVINLFGKPQIALNKDVKYSELLEQFITAFADDFSDREYQEDIIEFAINAWNFANMKVLLPERESNDAINYINRDLNFDLLNRMIDYKISHFVTYSNYIVDYELTETNGDPVLSVFTEKEDTYLASALEDMETQNPEDFEENYTNRNAIILKPLQPLLDWLTNLYPEDGFEIDQRNIYLLGEEIEDVDAWIKKKFDKLFKLELDAWHTNKKEWPKKRNYKMFKQWFEVEISMMVYDLERHPVSKY